jgi:hypothetical protein
MMRAEAPPIAPRQLDFDVVHELRVGDERLPGQTDLWRQHSPNAASAFALPRNLASRL